VTKYHLHVLSPLPQSSGANPKAPFLYPRSKGLTEQALAELGYKDTVIFRPAMLSNTQRPDARFAESALLCVRPASLSFVSEEEGEGSSLLTELFRAVTGVLSRFSDSVQIDVSGVNQSSKARVSESPLLPTSSC
jgi:hypothetical protein